MKFYGHHCLSSKRVWKEGEDSETRVKGGEPNAIASALAPSYKQEIKKLSQAANKRLQALTMRDEAFRRRAQEKIHLAEETAEELKRAAGKLARRMEEKDDLAEKKLNRAEARAEAAEADAQKANARVQELEQALEHAKLTSIQYAARTQTLKDLLKYMDSLLPDVHPVAEHLRHAENGPSGDDTLIPSSKRIRLSDGFVPADESFGPSKYPGAINALIGSAIRNNGLQQRKRPRAKLMVPKSRSKKGHPRRA